MIKENIMERFNILLSGKDILYLKHLGNQKKTSTVQKYSKNLINQTNKLVFRK